MGKPHDYGCNPPPLGRGFSKYTQDVPTVGDVWQCDFCNRWWVVTNRGLLYTNRHAPESWWRPVFWFDRAAHRRIGEAESV